MFGICIPKRPDSKGKVSDWLDIWDVFLRPIHPIPKSSQNPFFFGRCSSTVQSVWILHWPVVFSAKLGPWAPGPISDRKPSITDHRETKATWRCASPPFFATKWTTLRSTWLVDFLGMFHHPSMRFSQTSGIFRILWHVHAISKLHYQYDGRQEGHSARNGTLFWSEVLLCFVLGFWDDI